MAMRQFLSELRQIERSVAAISGTLGRSSPATASLEDLASKLRGVLDKIEADGRAGMPEEAETHGRRPGDREESRQATMDLQRFRDIMARLAVLFCGVEASNVDAAIQRALAELAEFAGVERAFVSRYEEGGAYVSAAYEWRLPGVPSVMSLFRRFPTATASCVCERHQRGEAIIVASTADLPPEMSALKRLWTELGVQAGLGVPLMRQGRAIGHTGFHCLRGPKQWSDQEVASLRVAAQMITNGLMIKEAGDALQQSELRYRTLVEQIPAATFIVKAEDLSLQYASPQMAELLGYRPEEIYGRPGAVIESLSPEERERALQRARTSFLPGRSFDEEFRMLHRSGKPVWVRCRFVVVEQAGKGRVVQGVLFDITKQKEAEALARQYERQLRALAAELPLIEERERRRLATDLHDGLTQLLALACVRLPEPQEGPQTLPPGLISEIRRLLQQAEATARSLTFQLSPPALYELGLIEAVRDLAEQLGKTNGLVIEVRAPSPTAVADERLRVVLFRSIRELLMNVVKHAQANRATVTLEAAGGRMRVQVSDDGRGFDPALLTAEGRGFGLLSIRERLHQCGGSLRIDSTPGEGTVCVLEVPLTG